MSEYLTIAETAELLRVKPDTIRERMRLGIFKPRVHYFVRRGMRPLFKRQAVIDWLEGRDELQGEGKVVGIRMARGYIAGSDGL